ncbi:MAG: hypothetical protein ACYSWX_14370 [Planctomycetota bacterium]|jgi:hypothetical protein
MTSSRALLAKVLIALGVVVAVDQLVLHLVLADGELGGQRLAPFDPPLFTASQREKLDWIAGQLGETGTAPESDRFDPELGWSAPRSGVIAPDRTFDSHGARTGPEPLRGPEESDLYRLVCLGDSFTFGAEVADEEAWPYLLDRDSEAVEIANLGQGGHGLGQTLLRWRRDGSRLRPDEVWMGWLPGAALRVVSAYRPAQNHTAMTIYPKPRFQLDENGALALLPSPATDLADVHALLSSSEAFHPAMVERDLWVARCPDAWAPAGSRLLHHTALGRLYLTWAEGRDRAVGPWLRDPSSEVYRVTRELVLQTRAEVEATGASFRFLILPGVSDLRYASVDPDPRWRPLMRDLQAAGVVVHDLTRTLLDAGAPERTELFMPQGHWSPEGNRIVADALRDLLPDR